MNGDQHDFEAVVRRRRMVRDYDPDHAVGRDVIEQLLALAIRAPSAGFSQGWRFLVLDEGDRLDQFWQATAGDGPADPWLVGMRHAPVLIVALSDKQTYLERYSEPDKGFTDRAESHWPVPYWDVDTGMAALLILLGATDRGLGACFFGVPGPKWPAFRAAFSVPEQLRPVGVISLGHPRPDRRSPSLRRGRRELADVVRYGSF